MKIGEVMGALGLNNFKKITYKNISEDYLISEYGDIYSLKTNKILKSNLDKDGYKEISLQLNNHKRQSFRIATLVMVTFGNCPPDNILDATIDHIDGNRLNNHISNLRWLERSENSSIRRVKPNGENNGSHILNEKQVIEICELIKENKMSLKQIAVLYNIDKTTISNIKRKKTWSYLTKEYSFKINKQLNKKDSEIQRENIKDLLMYGVKPKYIVNFYPSSIVYRENKKIFGFTRCI